MCICGFSELVGDSSCGVSSEYPEQLKCILLTECQYGISEDQSLCSEMALILDRKKTGLIIAIGSCKYHFCTFPIINASIQCKLVHALLCKIKLHVQYAFPE